MDLSEQATLAEEMAGLLRELHEVDNHLNEHQVGVFDMKNEAKRLTDRLKEIRLALGLPVRAAKAKPEEPKKRKTRSDKGTRVPHNPDCSATNPTQNIADDPVVKERVSGLKAEMEERARKAAVCLHCGELLRDCKCGADIPDASVERYRTGGKSRTSGLPTDGTITQGNDAAIGCRVSGPTGSPTKDGLPGTGEEPGD